MNIILLRGLARSQEHWGEFSAELKKRFPDSQVEALDLPGNGHFHQETSPISLDNYVVFLRQNSELLKQKKPLHLVGISMGGMVAHRWAAAHPKEIKSVVMINSSLHPSPFFQRMRIQSWKQLINIFATRDATKREDKILKLTTSLSPKDRKPLAAQWGELAVQRGTTVRNALRQILAASKSRWIPLPESCFLLVLASKHDQLVSFQSSVNLAKWERAPFRLHPTAGHDLPLEDTPWILNQLEDFYKIIH